jgi:hypothetical protein
MDDKNDIPVSSHASASSGHSAVDEIVTVTVWRKFVMQF